MKKNTRFYLTLALVIVALVLLIAHLMSMQSTRQTTTPTTTSSAQPNPTLSPSGNNASNGQTANTSQAQAANAVFNQINAARAQANLPALQWSNLLVNSAHKHNLTMMTYNQLAHQLPNEPDVGTRISQAG